MQLFYSDGRTSRAKPPSRQGINFPLLTKEGVRGRFERVFYLACCVLSLLATLALADDPPRDVIFPPDEIFGSLLADPKEPRFSASYYRIDFRSGPISAGFDGTQISAGFVSAGDTVGLWSRREANGRDGIQLGVQGVVFSQFNLDRTSGDLINTDYLFGVPLTWRRGDWSTRVRLFHQSSHLGDELLVRNRVIRVRNFGYEALDALVSRDADRFRFYGGVGAVFSSSTHFDPTILQAGLEYRPRWQWHRRPFGLRTTGVFGTDFKSLQEQDWRVTSNVVFGVELERPGASPKLRLLGTAMRGHYPFGQFFAETKVDALGLSLQFEL